MHRTYTKICLIDDNTTDLFITRSMLRLSNYIGELIEFESAEVALEYINSVDDIDLIITDINMPVLNGYELIRKYTGLSSIIILSPYITKTDLDYIIDDRVVSRLCKPISIEDISKFLI